MPARRTLVIQSQKPERLSGWQGACCESVQRWAKGHGFNYSLLDDALFDGVPAELREKFAGQPVVLSDLARLLQMQLALYRGYDRVIWCDADLLIFDDFEPAADPESFGRECWLQSAGAGIKSYRKIHNAWMSFDKNSVVLDFYRNRAEALLRIVEAPVVPQFIGPKLLTAWHNIVPFAVEERVGMLSPLATNALLTGNKKVLNVQRDGHALPLCAVNLSASCEGKEIDGISLAGADYQQLIEGLLRGNLRAELQGLA